MLTALRWLLVPVAIFAGCWSGIPLALLLRAAADFFCPADMRVSGMCHAPWFALAESCAIYAGVIVGACLTVLLAFAAAPRFKFAAACVAFAAGAIYAAVIAGFAAGALLPALSAIVAGLGALAWLWRRATVKHESITSAHPPR